MSDGGRCEHPPGALARVSGVVVCCLCGTLTDLPSPDAQTVTFGDNDGPLVDVAAFGARGDGEHDDAPAFQAAVDSFGNVIRDCTFTDADRHGFRIGPEEDA